MLTVTAVLSYPSTYNSISSNVSFTLLQRNVARTTDMKCWMSTRPLTRSAQHYVASIQIATF